MKLLPSSLVSGLKTGGCVRWGDIAEAERALKKRGTIEITPGDAREVPGGIVLRTGAAAQPETIDHLHPIPGLNSIGAEVITIRPGLVFGGCGWVEPVIGSTSIFNTPAPALVGRPSYVLLKIVWRPLVAATQGFFGVLHRDWQAPVGIELVSAEIVGSAAVTAETYAQAAETVTGLNHDLAVTADGVYYKTIGVKQPDGVYFGSGFRGHVLCTCRSGPGGAPGIFQFEMVASAFKGTAFVF
jgi:hypothetical protein